MAALSLKWSCRPLLSIQGFSYALVTMHFRLSESLSMTIIATTSGIIGSVRFAVSRIGNKSRNASVCLSRPAKVFSALGCLERQVSCRSTQ